MAENLESNMLHGGACEQMVGKCVCTDASGETRMFEAAWSERSNVGECNQGFSRVWSIS